MVAQASEGSSPGDGFHIAGLDGLRAVAFLVVFASHAFPRLAIPGGLGVTIFFFLSGYLITTLLRLERDRRGGVALGAFYLRRALRILPPMYLALAGAIALSAALGHSMSGGAIAAQALHGSNLHSILRGTAEQPLGTHVLWSLAVEEHFYLVFPLIFLALARLTGRPGRQALALLAMCAAVLAWRIVLERSGAASDRIAFATDTRFDSILFGCAFALWRNPALPGPRFGGRGGAVGLIAGLAVLGATIAARDPGFRETWRYTLQGLALAPVFYAVIAYSEHPLFRPLGWAWVRRLGVYSYVLYLVHHTLLLALQTRWPDHPGLTALGGGALALATAAIVHRFVERPAARLRRRLSQLA